MHYSSYQYSGLPLPLAGIISFIIIAGMVVALAIILYKDYYLTPIFRKRLKLIWKKLNDDDPGGMVPELYVEAISISKSYRIKFESIGCAGIKEFYQIALNGMKRNTEKEIGQLTSRFHQNILAYPEDSVSGQALRSNYTEQVGMLEERLRAFEAQPLSK